MAQKTDIVKELKRRMKLFIKETLKDISIELGDEFDRNFEREAFFNERWARRKHNDDQSRGLLVGDGVLRRSIKPEIMNSSVIFSSDVPYAAIHNEGGTITVTSKMKRYFWYRYLLLNRSKLKRKKQVLTDEEEFYKCMALKKVGSKIVIPKRQFIGTHPEVEKLILDIANRNKKIFQS